MKKVILLILIGISINMSLAQQPSSILETNLGEMLKAYEDYFKEYDPLAPISVRRTRFNDIVNKENPNLSKSDREKAFSIVDAYIRADKGLPVETKISEQDQKEIENMLAEAKEKKEVGVKAMMGEVNRYKKMSYSEYKTFITQNGQILLDEIEIRKAYNAMHKNDGKQVPINGNFKKTKVQNQMEAVDILQHPEKHTYAEFRSAILFLKPDIPETEIRKIWESKKK